MKPENLEVIMRIDFSATDGKQIVVHAEKVQELVRCGECTNRLVNSRGENRCWADHDNGVNSLPLDWFCADGRKGEEDETD